MNEKKGHITENKVSCENEYFPMCIVWTPIPILSWFFPILGHAGLSMSDGRIRDFAGSYAIGVNRTFITVDLPPFYQHNHTFIPLI